MKKKGWMMGGLILIILVSLGVGFWISERRQREMEISNISGALIQDGIIPGYTAEEIEEMMQREADKTTFSFEINGRPAFEDGLSEGTLRIANPPYSAYAIVIEIKLDSNQQTVFKTEKLLPNQYIERAQLFVNLKAGEYPATAMINVYDIETGEQVGTSSAKIVIKINN